MVPKLLIVNLSMYYLFIFAVAIEKSLFYFFGE